MKLTPTIEIIKSQLSVIYSWPPTMKRLMRCLRAYNDANQIENAMRVSAMEMSKTIRLANTFKIPKMGPIM